jgi:hypothetical protein
MGGRYRSQVGTTEIIIVRAASREADLTCGGLPLIGIDQSPPADLVPAEGLDAETPVGKRYVDHAGTLELIVTKGGIGTLALDGAPLTVKSAKLLPSSD